jgi:putative Flp pilus-assembly TadE/G-like protein
MKKLATNQRGQSMVLTVLFITVLLAIATAVLDVGAWYRTHRQTQSTADASALAGAQHLPDFPGTASDEALDYSSRNGGGVLPADVQISGTNAPNDTIKVTARKQSNGVFSKLFGINSVTARSTAKARAGTMGTARWAAPIGVDYRHEALHCDPNPNPTPHCAPDFDTNTEIDFEKVGPGAFRLINIDGSRGGTGPQDVGEWIRHGLDKDMKVQEWYYSDPGMKPNSAHITSALDSLIPTHKEILIPIYSDMRAQGAGFEYWIVGWVGWVVDSYVINGSKTARIQGHFTRVTWSGFQSERGTDDGLGARSVELIE